VEIVLIRYNNKIKGLIRSNYI